MDEKIREVAARHSIPERLLSEVIQMERERVTLRNRKLTPAILQRIAAYAEEGSSPEVDR